MKKFLVLYLATPEGFEQWKADDEQKTKEKEKEGMDAWTQWMKNNEKSIVDGGSPIGKTKRVDAGGISDMKNEVGAYTIVQAETHEAAAELFLNHPHFTLFPGDRVEIMECLPMPEM